MERWTVKATGVVSKRVGSQVVVLDLESSVYFTTGDAGLVLWELLMTGATEADLADALRNEYGLDADRALADAKRFLSDGAEAGILVSEDLPSQ